jgi:hypothetical protein
VLLVALQVFMSHKVLKKFKKKTAFEFVSYHRCLYRKHISLVNTAQVRDVDRVPNRRRLP